MPAFIRNPGDWQGILDAIKGGDTASAMARLAERDRRLDGYFSVIDKSTYTPALMQNTTTVTYQSNWLIEGMRIGPWVMMNGSFNITGGGTASYFKLDLPPMLPIAQASAFDRVLGTIRWYDQSAGTQYQGMLLSKDSTHVYSSQDGQSDFVTWPAVQAANLDQVSFEIQYMTDLSTV